MWFSVFLSSNFVCHSWSVPMMKITSLSHLFKWEDLHNWWLTKYFFAPLYLLDLFILATSADGQGERLLGYCRRRLTPDISERGLVICCCYFHRGQDGRGCNHVGRTAGNLPTMSTKTGNTEHMGPLMARGFGDWGALLLALAFINLGCVLNGTLFPIQCTIDQSPMCPGQK